LLFFSFSLLCDSLAVLIENPALKLIGNQLHSARLAYGIGILLFLSIWISIFLLNLFVVSTTSAQHFADSKIQPAVSVSFARDTGKVPPKRLMNIIPATNPTNSQILVRALSPQPTTPKITGYRGIKVLPRSDPPREGQVDVVFTVIVYCLH
jgi:hypothetical protein